MPTDSTDYRAQAIAKMSQDATDTSTASDDCGPEPERPTYFSPQSVRDRWIKWNLCKAGVRDE